MIYVRLKPNWNGVFKRTIKGQDGKQVKVRTFTPGEVVGVEPNELPSLRRDIGNAIQPVEWSDEHGKFRPIDVGEIDLDAMVTSVLDGTFVDSPDPPVPENVDRLPPRRRHPAWNLHVESTEQAEAPVTNGQTPVADGQTAAPVTETKLPSVPTAERKDGKAPPKGRGKKEGQKPAEATSTPTPTGNEPTPPAPENAAGDASTDAKADVTADASGTKGTTDGANAGG